MDFDRKIGNFLVNWSRKKERKPLILRGARQVGKTRAVIQLGKKFEHFIHINLEKIEHSRLLPEGTTLSDFEKTVTLAFGQPLADGKTLLFIDEIQEAPHLVKLLRFFYEDRPGLHVVAAGSLFEVKLKEEALSFPVGRVEYAFLGPADFFEFLGAVGEKKLLELLASFDFKEKIPAGVHEKAMSLFGDYAVVGGMPEAVEVYSRSRSVAEVNNVYSNLFTSFKDDVYKYASLARGKHVGFVLEQAPLFAGLSVSYEKFAGSAYKSREMHLAFDLLEKAMLVKQARATKSRNLPLVPKLKKPAKLIFLDAGLVNFQMGIQNELIKVKDLTDFYQGRIAEQIVGQQLMSSFMSSPPELFYWYGGEKSEAEVDFCLTSGGRVVGIEVKSGKRGRMRSAGEFMKATGSGKVIRVYGGEFNRDREIVSLPFYLVPRWREVLRQ